MQQEDFDDYIFDLYVGRLSGITREIGALDLTSFCGDAEIDVKEGAPFEVEAGEHEELVIENRNIWRVEHRDSDEREFVKPDAFRTYTEFKKWIVEFSETGEPPQQDRLVEA